MTVAIVHYHLGPGGVSQVIAAGSRALTKAGISHVILAGDFPANLPADLPVRAVSGLGYSDEFTGKLASNLRAAAVNALGRDPDIWHFHNHSLGKNRELPDTITRLAEENQRLLLQIHDLAEDGRPENQPLLAEARNLYPLSPRIHYAFLNSRDRNRFIHAGLPENRAHVLPNPIEAPALIYPSGNPSDAPRLLYPVRGIRRKNLGEFLLLAALAPPGTRAAVTRAPLNPRWRRIHDDWHNFAAELNVPVEFDVVNRIAPRSGDESSFPAWLEAATHLVTTSVSEGFGMVFLEAAAAGKPLLGRNLPHLTADHAAHGIQSGRFYDRLLVPREWIDEETLDRFLRTSLQKTWSAWQHPVSPGTLASARAALFHDDFLDFGNLPEVFQQSVIRKLHEPGNHQIPLVEISGTPQPATGWLAHVLTQRGPTASPHQLAPYSPSAYQARLREIFTQLHDAPAAPVRQLAPKNILGVYLAPETFHFLTASDVGIRPEPRLENFRAIVFDIYGTLLVAPAGGVKHDPTADATLREIIARFGHSPPESPSAALATAVRRHHAESTEPFPEIDLRQLWREVLSLPANTDTTGLVIATESAWHPASWIPGAAETIRRLAAAGIPLGLLSNAQCNTLTSLGDNAHSFSPSLTILSYQHLMAKPSPALFELLVNRLAQRGISPSETLYIGNDPRHDIIPANASGFKTALFTGHPDSLRPGICLPDYEIRSWQPGKPTPH
jgi:FMN phosphatase YigB (HAD superfamily)/glycosyltransferase involved in cell wall biosynthesis